MPLDVKAFCSVNGEKNDYWRSCVNRYGVGGGCVKHMNDTVFSAVFIDAGNLLTASRAV